MSKLLSIFLLLVSIGFARGQSYRVYFTDKANNTALLNEPYKILSINCLERRAARGIPIDFRDLPVAKEYLSALRSLGAEVEMSSRWFNYAKVQYEGEMAGLEGFSFVKRVEVVEAYKIHFTNISAHYQDTLIYGPSGGQIEMLNGQYLHEHDQRGQGMRIAVLDGGFVGTPGLLGLSRMRDEGRIKDVFNFVTGDTNVFQGGSHGTSVLGVMGGFIDSSYVGSAYLADFYLYSTENEITETTSEMDNWLAAAERADSLGVDVINTSLGYTQFDNGIGDYNYLAMDGNTTIITRAADMAAKKGILVVASAGNLGEDDWRYISAPADGDSVLSVGGVFPDGSLASFSSIGPSADGRIKPDVSAQGVANAILIPGGVSFGNGTSFSAPVVSGLAACLWQGNPSLSNMDILELIQESSSQYYQPDNFLGYGIPNFQTAQWSIGIDETGLAAKPIMLKAFPNPTSEKVWIEWEEDHRPKMLRLYDLAGNVQLEQTLIGQNALEINIPGPSGIYLLYLHFRDEVHIQKIVKH